MGRKEKKEKEEKERKEKKEREEKERKEKEEKEKKEKERKESPPPRVKAKLPEWKLPSGAQKRRWRKEREEIEARAQSSAGTSTGPALHPLARFQQQRKKDYEARIALEEKAEEEERKQEEEKKKQKEEDERKKQEREKRFAPASAASGPQEEPMEFDNTRTVVAGQDGAISADIRNEFYRPAHEATPPRDEEEEEREHRSPSPRIRDASGIRHLKK